MFVMYYIATQIHSLDIVSNSMHIVQVKSDPTRIDPHYQARESC